MAVYSVMCSFCADTVFGLLSGKSTVKGLVVGMDVIFMSFENFCFALFLSVTIILCIVKGIVDVFRWIKERVKNDKN
jgi:hypothetical protein